MHFFVFIKYVDKKIIWILRTTDVYNLEVYEYM